MLPPRSKRYAGHDGKLPRTQFLTKGQLIVVAALMLALFYLAYPRQSLYEQLQQQKELDPLTEAYLVNLQRAEPSQPDLLLIELRLRGSQIPLSEAESIAARIVASGRADLLEQTRELLAQIRLRELKPWARKDNTSVSDLTSFSHLYEAIVAEGSSEIQLQAHEIWSDALLHRRNGLPSSLWKHQVQDLLGRIQKISPLPPILAFKLSLLASAAGFPEAGQSLLEQIDDTWLNSTLPELTQQALAAGQYETAAALHFLARTRAQDRTTARAHLRRGLELLMEGNLYVLALERAERYLGDLADDAPTLRYLTQMALAAGNPQAAARYAERLVFAANRSGE